MDEEKKVDAVREFYQHTSGDFFTVARLQILSKWPTNLNLSQIQIICAQLGLESLSPSSASLLSTGVMASPCTWLTTEVSATMACVTYLVAHNCNFIVNTPLRDTIYFTVGLNKHKVLVCSFLVSLQVTHVCSHLTTMGLGKQAG